MRPERQIKVSIAKIPDHYAEHARYTSLQKEFCSSWNEKKINMTKVQGFWGEEGEEAR